MYNSFIHVESDRVVVYKCAGETAKKSAFSDVSSTAMMVDSLIFFIFGYRFILLALPFLKDSIFDAACSIKNSTGYIQ